MKKILIIDDEPELCESIAGLLKDEGYETLISHRGNDGWNMIQSEKPDLVLLDIALPDLDGTIVYENLRRNRETKNIKVIFLTALASGAPQQLAGIDRVDYTIFSKPTHFDALKQEIERLVGPA